MEKEFVPYAQSLQLRELGFEEPCFGYYKHTTIPNKIISNDLIVGFIKDDRIYNDTSKGSSLVGLGKGLVFAPTFSQAFRWFRDKHNLLNIIDCYISTPLEWFIRIDKISNDSLDYKMDITEESEDKVYLTYEEAEIACLGGLIKIIKNKI